MKLLSERDKQDILSIRYLIYLNGTSEEKETVFSLLVEQNKIEEIEALVYHTNYLTRVRALNFLLRYDKTLAERHYRVIRHSKTKLSMGQSLKKLNKLFD